MYAAVLADLAGGAGERADVAHLDHGAAEVAEEALGVGAVGQHERLGGVGAGVGAGEEALVGGEQALLLQQVLEVVVVEGVRGAGVRKNCCASSPAAARMEISVSTCREPRWRRAGEVAPAGEAGRAGSSGRRRARRRRGGKARGWARTGRGGEKNDRWGPIVRLKNWKPDYSAQLEWRAIYESAKFKNRLLNRSLFTQI